MTLANDFVSDAAANILSDDAKATTRFVLRVSQLVIGVGLTFWAALIWIAPGASWSTDLMLIKAVLSITAFATGIAVLSIGRTQETSEIEIDAAQGALRIMRVSGNGERDVESTVRFEDLHAVETDGAVLRFWQDENTVLAEVENAPSQIMNKLSYALRRSGKLA